MSQTPTPTPIQTVAPDIARRVGLILASLVALVAHRFLRTQNVSLILPLCGYLNRTARRFGRLMTLLAANRLPKPRPPRLHRPKPDAARAARLPSGHLWLIRALPNDAAALASQLDHLLNEPAVADLLAAHPAAASLLRPLGRMLGIEALAPKRPRPKRLAQAASPREAPPPIPPPPQDPTYRPSAKWPRAHWPRPSWPPAGPGLPEPA